MDVQIAESLRVLRRSGIILEDLVRVLDEITKIMPPFLLDTSTFSSAVPPDGVIPTSDFMCAYCDTRWVLMPNWPTSAALRQFQVKHHPTCPWQQAIDLLAEINPSEFALPEESPTQRRVDIPEKAQQCGSNASGAWVSGPGEGYVCDMPLGHEPPHGMAGEVTWYDAYEPTSTDPPYTLVCNQALYTSEVIGHCNLYNDHEGIHQYARSLNRCQRFRILHDSRQCWLPIVHIGHHMYGEQPVVSPLVIYADEHKCTSSATDYELECERNRGHDGDHIYGLVRWSDEVQNGQ